MVVLPQEGCASNIVPPSPGKLSLLFFLFLIVCLFLFFWGQYFYLKFSWVCICFLFLFSSFILFFAIGQGFSPWVLPFGLKGFLFPLDPHMAECNGFFPSSLSLPPGRWEHCTRKLFCRENIAFSCIITIILGQNWLFLRFCVDWAPFPWNWGCDFPREHV